MSTIVSATPDASPPGSAIPQLPVFAITGHVWDRLPDEPTVWYERFDRYYRPLVECRRSLLNAYKLYLADTCRDVHVTTASHRWRDKANLYNWHQRAIAYDDHQRAIARVDEEQAKLESRKRRIAALDVLLDKGLQCALAAKPENTPLSQSSTAIKTAVAELRIDHHDVPATQHNVDVRAILAVLPVELRAVVAQTLKKET